GGSIIRVGLFAKTKNVDMLTDSQVTRAGLKSFAQLTFTQHDPVQIGNLLDRLRKGFESVLVAFRMMQSPHCQSDQAGRGHAKFLTNGAAVRVARCRRRLRSAEIYGALNLHELFAVYTE